MIARRGNLAAVPGEGERGPEELVRERPRVLAAVGICQQPGCGADVQTMPTLLDGLVVFDARPVPLTRELVEKGDAYFYWRGPVSVIVNALTVPEGAYAGVDTALTPHVHTSHAVDVTE